MNAPPPVPLFVKELDIVGFREVLQQIPLAVTPDMQSPVIFPPDDAVVVPIAEMAEVDIAGSTAAAVMKLSFPYTVPAGFVA